MATVAVAVAAGDAEVRGEARNPANLRRRSRKDDGGDSLEGTEARPQLAPETRREEKLHQRGRCFFFFFLGISEQRRRLGRR